MDSDDDHYDSFDTESSVELDSAVCGARYSSFEAISAEDIVNLMTQYIDDVGAVIEKEVIGCSLLRQLLHIDLHS